MAADAALLVLELTEVNVLLGARRGADTQCCDEHDEDAQNGSNHWLLSDDPRFLRWEHTATCQYDWRSMFRLPIPFARELSSYFPICNRALVLLALQCEWVALH
jgi:hypothetical protein